MAEVTRPVKTVYGGEFGRNVTLQRPNAMRPGRQYPLILVLHNYDADGVNVQGRMDLLDIPQFDNGCFALAPNGTTNTDGKRYWYASSSCCDVFSQQPADEQYLVTIVQQVLGDYSGWIDTSRVWVTGYSNGACMALTLAMNHQDIFTSCAVVAGAHPDPTVLPAGQPVNILLAFADGDTVIPYNGGTGGSPLTGPTLSCDANLALWAAHNGGGGSLQAKYDDIDLITTGTPTGTGAECSRARYSNTPAGGAVEKWLLNGAFHTMTFQSLSYAGQKWWAWLYSHPRP